MSNLEPEAAAGAVKALFLGDQQKTEWMPYTQQGPMFFGSGGLTADHIQVRDGDGQITRFPLPGDPTPQHPYLMQPGEYCELLWPVDDARAEELFAEQWYD